MSKVELMELLKKRACEYRDGADRSVNRNNHMNDCNGEFSCAQKEVDALLVDFLNFVAGKMGFDYGLYVEDLRKE